MRTLVRLSLAALVVGWAARPAPAQQKPAVLPPPAAAPAAPAPAGNAVAATVNGQPIAEAAVQRGLKRVPPTEHSKARPEILDYLIDNLLIDQYLIQQKVAVDPKDVTARIGEIQAELKKREIASGALRLGPSGLRAEGLQLRRPTYMKEFRYHPG